MNIYIYHMILLYVLHGQHFRVWPMYDKICRFRGVADCSRYVSLQMLLFLFSITFIWYFISNFEWFLYFWNYIAGYADFRIWHQARDVFAMRVYMSKSSRVIAWSSSKRQLNLVSKLCLHEQLYRCYCYKVIL